MTVCLRSRPSAETPSASVVSQSVRRLCVSKSLWTDGSLRVLHELGNIGSIICLGRDGGGQMEKEGVGRE
jgi:hypothetical protein